MLWVRWWINPMVHSISKDETCRALFSEPFEKCGFRKKLYLRTFVCTPLFFLNSLAWHCRLIEELEQIKVCFAGRRAVTDPWGTALWVFAVPCFLQRFVSKSAHRLHGPSWCAIQALTRVTLAGFVSGMLSSRLEGGQCEFSCVFPLIAILHTNLPRYRDPHSAKEFAQSSLQNVHFHNRILSIWAAIFIICKWIGVAFFLHSRGLLFPGIFCHEYYSENVKLQEGKAK